MSNQVKFNYLNSLFYNKDIIILIFKFSNDFTNLISSLNEKHVNKLILNAIIMVLMNELIFIKIKDNKYL